MATSGIGAGQPARVGHLQTLSVREDVLFTDHKQRESRGIRKRAEKLVEKLEAALLKVLDPNETILYLAPVKAPVSWWQQYTLGWYVHQVTKSVFVFTDRRIVHVLLRSNNTWRRMVRSVTYGDIVEARGKGWLSRTLLLRYRNGEEEKYWGLERRDAKKIGPLLAERLPDGASQATQRGGIVSLCPECRAELTPGVYSCAGCGTRFKDERTMLLRSLLIPGGGYFYTGYWFLGVADFLVEAVLSIMVLIGLLDIAGVLPSEPGQEHMTVVELAVLAGILAAEKLLTIQHCRHFVRDFIPLER